MGGNASTARTESGEIGMLSVIIPALNEEENIAKCIESSRSHGLRRNPEVIVVDGGSSDKTKHIAKRLGAKVFSTKRGRGIQLNRGWRMSKGDWVLFLHADSQLPPSYGKLIENGVKSNPATSWGCFKTIQTEIPGFGMRLITMGVELRTKLFHIPYGDQALFAKASTLESLNGFKNSRLLEDLDFVQRAKRKGFGYPIILDQPVFTSGRRWKQHGLWRTMAMNQSILLRHLMGIDSDSLADLYYGK